MGNSQTTFNSVHKVVATDYQLIGKNTTVRWGELFEMKNIKTGQMVFMQEKHAGDLETHQRTIEECTYHISLNHKNLSSIYGFAGGEAPDVFTNTYKVCVFFEHVVNSLSGVIRARRVPLASVNGKSPQRSTQTFQYFDESELLRFMNQLVEVFDFLQRNGICQGDITPDVCFFSREGILKVLNRKLVYGDVSSFEQAEQGNSNVFLTPTELGALANERSKPSENRYKADVFRLGMTLLECATLQKSSDIYDWSTYTVNLDVLSSRLIEVKERYSSAFYDPLREMLRFEEEKRPNFNVLNRHLQEEAAQNFLVNMQPYLDEENDTGMRKSGFGMGPKLITNFPARPGGYQASQGPDSLLDRQHQAGKRGSAVLQQAGGDSFEHKRQRETRIRGRREEDLDDTTEFEADMKVNKVPFTETRNSVERTRDPSDSPAKRLQRMIVENRGAQEEARKTSPDVRGPSTPGNRQRFSIKDFFRRDTPNKEPLNQSNQEGRSKASKPPLSPKLSFNGNTPSSGQHRRAFSGVVDSYQSKILSQSGLTQKPQGDQRENSFSQKMLDQQANTDYSNLSRRSPTAQLPPKDSFNQQQYMNRQHSPITTPRQAENVTSSDYYYSVPSNPVTQRTQRPSYRAINGSDSFVGDNGDVSIPNDHLDNVNVSVDDQRQGRSNSQISTKNIINQNMKEEANKRKVQVPALGMEQEPKNGEHDLVEAILRKVLNSAGISPKKQLKTLSTENKADIGYAKPQSLIRPVQVEMNENISREEDRVSAVSSKYYDIENMRSSYSSIGKPVTKPKLEDARDERRVMGRPLMDQFTQSIEPRTIVSPKFGFGAVSGESRSFMVDNDRRNFYDRISVNTDYGKPIGRDSPPVRNSVLKNSYLEDSAGLKVEDRFDMAMQRSQRSKGYMRNLTDKMNRSTSRNASMEPTARSTHIQGGDGFMFRGSHLNEARLNI